MPDRVEPPVLLSRLLAFVFATALVVLGALGITLWQMIPLNRPQVFFLETKLRPDMVVEIRDAKNKGNPNSQEQYIKSFIKEYVRARNEIIQDVNVMQRKWGNGEDGIVNIWSASEIYDEFIHTTAWNYMMYSDVNIPVRCSVEFPASGGIHRLNDTLTRWQVSFTYLCSNNDGQTAKKDYTIIVDLENKDKEDKAKIKWGDRLNNPLGMRVVGYKVEKNESDPLNNFETVISGVSDSINFE